jgi:LAGLIDADG endonuclease
MNRGDHLTWEGLAKIVAIRATLNKGLSPKAVFPNIIPLQRPLVKDQVIKDPNWIAGFVSGEGCFMVQIKNSLRHSLAFKYRVSSLKDISIIIDHFDKYPLLTQKRANYLLFKRAFELVLRKEHNTPEGFHELLRIKAAINLGFSDSLKAAFPNTIPVDTPRVEDNAVSDPNWLAGFVEAEGCFYIGVAESTESALGYRIQLTFKITQHSRDEFLMGSLVKYLDCGNIYKKSSVAVLDYEVKKKYLI